jgi:hypothetical protein
MNDFPTDADNGLVFFICYVELVAEMRPHVSVAAHIRTKMGRTARNFTQREKKPVDLKT